MILDEPLVFWCRVVVFCLLRNKYAFYTVHSSDVQMNLQPRKIGVFVDFENGQVHWGNFVFSSCKAMSTFLYQLCLCVPPGLILQRECSNPHLHIQQFIQWIHLPVLQPLLQQVREERSATDNHSSKHDGVMCWIFISCESWLIFDIYI